MTTFENPIQSTNSNDKHHTAHDMAGNQRDSTSQETKRLDELIDIVCGRIAPLWPLKNFVAVNPFVGMSDMSFQKASDTIARIVGKGIYMPRDYYRQQLQKGNISRIDIKQAIERCGSSLDIADVEEILQTRAPMPNMGMASVSEVLDRVEGGIWSSFVTERISTFCAAYFDLGQAMVQMPWRSNSLYDAWRKSASIDRSPAMMGLKQFRHEISRLPADPREAIAWAVKELGIRDVTMERYLHASLLSIGGWASWTRYLRWQAELEGRQDDSIIDLLAIRLMWDVLLYKAKHSAALVARWREMLAASMRPPSSKRKAAAEIDRIMLNAMEINFQRVVINGLKENISLAKTKNRKAASRPKVQAAFCIDVRSEVFRRSFETISAKVQTLGFAGFFGIFIEYVPLGAISGRSHVPVIFNPSYVITEQIKDSDQQQNEIQINKRRRRIGLSKAWKGFKFSASSCFSFVEAAGLIYGPKLLSDGFGWTRPVPDPANQGIDKIAIDKIVPALTRQSTSAEIADYITGIPESDWLDQAERILRSMSMTDNFAPLVLLVGHGSSSVNNPHATSLDCGACAGQTGEASARVVAAILNQKSVRDGLQEKGIHIPEDTWFLAGLHDTTTDYVKLFDTDDIPKILQENLRQLEQWLEQAADLTRLQRAVTLGTSALSDRDIEKDVCKRSHDWSQVRPEWALANNAAFIAAPRERTLDVNLEGRSFLHEYQWQKDEGFKILELIMTAPMIVANWINMQYYGSVVNNQRFGSGNKVLHNVVGGAIGVLEGNGGDLRVGLPMQSLHDGNNWVHEPIRLSVFIEAPEAAINDIITRHEVVRQLVDNGWVHLFRISEEGNIHRRARTGQWHMLD